MANLPVIIDDGATSGPLLIDDGQGGLIPAHIDELADACDCCEDGGPPGPGPCPDLCPDGSSQCYRVQFSGFGELGGDLCAGWTGLNGEEVVVEPTTAPPGCCAWRGITNIPVAPGSSSIVTEVTMEICPAGVRVIIVSDIFCGLASDFTGYASCLNGLVATGFRNYELRLVSGIATATPTDCPGQGGQIPQPLSGIIRTIELEPQGLSNGNCIGACIRAMDPWLFPQTVLNPNEVQSFSQDNTESFCSPNFQNTGAEYFSLFWTVTPIAFADPGVRIELRKVVTTETGLSEVLEAVWRFAGDPSFIYEGGEQVASLVEAPGNSCSTLNSFVTIRSF